MNTYAAACALLAAALAADPVRALPARRLRLLRPPDRPQRARRGWVLPACCGVAFALLTAVLLTGPWRPFVAAAVGLGTYLVARRLSRGVSDTRVAPLHLAATWDLLGACLVSGLPVPTAVRAVTPHLPEPVASALRRSAELLALGADPVEAWAPVLHHPETAPLARAARRSARSGTALAGVATALAAEVRAEASDAAESRAQRAAVLVSGPLGLCFLPAFLCLGIVPVALGFAGELSVAW